MISTISVPFTKLTRELVFIYSFLFSIYLLIFQIHIFMPFYFFIYFILLAFLFVQ